MINENQQEINTKLQNAKNSVFSKPSNHTYKCNNCNYSGKIISYNKYHKAIFQILIMCTFSYVVFYFFDPDKLITLLYNDLYSFTNTAIDEKMKNNILNYGLPILLIFLFAILFSIVKIMYKCPSCNFSIKEDIHIKKLLSQVEFSDEANIIEHFEYITDFKDKKRDNAN